MQRKIMTLLAGTLLALNAHAIEFISTNAYVTGESEIIANELWIASGNFRSEGTHQDDLFAFSGTALQLDGTCSGNVWGAANTIAGMSGTCERNLRLTGKTVRIDGTVNGNLMALAETVALATNTLVGGDAKLVGMSIVVEGTIEGDLSITSTRIVTLDGTVEGNVNIIAPDILLSRTAKIGGNLHYTANKELFPQEGAVGGELKRVLPAGKAGKSLLKQLSDNAVWFAAALLAGIPFLALFPVASALAVQTARQTPWRCLWIGALMFIGLPLIAVTCIGTYVGLPLGLLLIAGWGSLGYLGKIVSAVAAASVLLRRRAGSFRQLLLTLAVGLLLIYVGLSIPFIALSVFLTTTWIGMGALLLGMLRRKQLFFQISQNAQDLAESVSNVKENEEK